MGSTSKKLKELQSCRAKKFSLAMQKARYNERAEEAVAVEVISAKNEIDLITYGAIFAIIACVFAIIISLYSFFSIKQ